MIKLRVKLYKAIDEIAGLIKLANDFSDCRFEKIEFKLWKENVRAFLNRTYDGDELADKMGKFNSIYFISAGWDSDFPSLESIDVDSSGLGDAVALLTAWKNDLGKRRGEHMLERFKRVLLFLLGLGAVGGVVYGVYVKFYRQEVVNSGRIDNLNMGDNPTQNNIRINAEGSNIQISN